MVALSPFGYEWPTNAGEKRAINPLLWADLDFPEYLKYKAIEKVSNFLWELKPEVLNDLKNVAEIKVESAPRADLSKKVSGVYSKLTHKILLFAPLVVGREELLVKQEVFHELWHALLTFRNFGKARGLLYWLKVQMDRGMKTIGGSLFQEVNEVRNLYKAFRVRGRIWQALMVKEFFTRLQKLPQKSINRTEANSFFGQLFGSMDLLRFSFQGQGFSKKAFQKVALKFLANALKIENPEITVNKGTTKVSFVAETRNQYAAKDPLGLQVVGAMIALTSYLLFPDFSAVIGETVGLCLCLFSSQLPKLFDGTYSSEKVALRFTENQTVNFLRKGKTFSIVLPDSMIHTKVPSDPYSLVSNDEEEYLVQGMAYFNNSEATNLFLKKYDPQLHQYIENRFGYLTMRNPLLRSAAVRKNFIKGVGEPYSLVSTNEQDYLVQGLRFFKNSEVTNVFLKKSDPKLHHYIENRFNDLAVRQPAQPSIAIKGETLSVCDLIRRVVRGKGGLEARRVLLSQITALNDKVARSSS